MLALLLVANLVTPLLDDRPPLADLARFPPLEVCENMRAVGAAYRVHVEARMHFPSWQYWEWSVVAAEAQWCYDTWDWLHWTHKVTDTECKRRSLATLRELLGPEAYYAGRMPPCVPIWRFAEVHHIPKR